VVDMGSMPDLGMASVDLAGCIGGMPDEDNDGRANVCDLCPADYDPTPTDSDGDALPDACDPDPTRAPTKPIYFDPFDADSKHWVGTYTFATSSTGQSLSYIQLDSNSTNAPISAGNSVDLLPQNVRVQTFVLAHGVLTLSAAKMVLYLGTGTDPTAP